MIYHARLLIFRSLYKYLTFHIRRELPPLRFKDLSQIKIFWTDIDSDNMVFAKVK